MQSLNDYVMEYTMQLKKGCIQKAYKGIMTFMSGLKSYMESRHPEYSAGALYFGYMDMTYFAFTPVELKKKNLKIAVVYLHKQNKFEAWLGGSNRKIQAEYIEQLKDKDIGAGRLSQVKPGVDSIIELEIIDSPDFNQTEDLMQKTEIRTIEFTEKIISIIQGDV